MKSLSWILGLLLAFSACRANDPPPGQYDVGPTLDSWVRPDLPGSCETTPKLSPPQLDPYPDPTGQQQQPFRGVAPGATLITARVGSLTFFPVNVGSDGRFCVEATLIADAQNTVTLTPWDSNTCPGIDTVVNLTHRTSATADGGSVAMLNVAKGQPVSSDQKPDDGTQLSYAADGDPNSKLKLSFTDIEWNGDCDKYTWVRIDFGKVYNINNIKLRWPPQVGKFFAVCYTVLLSHKSAPVDPDTAAVQDWISVKEESNGTSQDQEITISPTPARYVAVLLYENDKTGPSETFEVGDIEVWGYDPGATPPPPADECE